MQEINCFAKINPVLRIGPKRPDGFHAVFTIYQTISLYDTLNVELVDSPGIRITVSESTIPCDERNLVWQAAEMLGLRVGYKGGLRVHIKKRIPVGGGLGGGSSDAAGMLLLMNKLLGTPLGSDELMVLAADLGSDVPFFLVGGTAMGTGRGERIRPLADMEPRPFLAVFPDSGFPTGEMYNLLDRYGAIVSLDELEVAESRLFRGGRVAEWENSFDQVVQFMSGEVANCMQQFRDEGIPVILAGSGSTFLVFFDSGSLEKIKQMIPSHWRSSVLQTRMRREVLSDFI